jgi:DNA polymerase III delta prime subunit
MDRGKKVLLEAVKGQNIAVRMLEREIQRGGLPGTLLFYGPDRSGKFFTALELARVLNCHTKGSHSCRCSSCMSIQKLVSPDLYVISSSDLNNTFAFWKACGVRKENVQQLIQDIRRLELSLFWEESMGKAFEELAQLMRTQEDVRDNFEQLMNYVTKLLRSKKNPVITINMIREVQKFLSRRSGDALFRVVIVDGAEYMNEEASNSFLKISEENPPDSYIILTTTNRDLLKETIVSRCRAYRFVALSPDTRQEIDAVCFGCETVGTLKRETYDYDKDLMVSYLDRLKSAGRNLEALVKMIDEITTNGHVFQFLDFMKDRMRKQMLTEVDLPMGKMYEIEGFVKTISEIKNAIVNNNVNQEVAFTDFIMNDIHFIMNAIPGVYV